MMTRTVSLKSTRPEYRELTCTEGFATAAEQRRYAEELSDVETAVSRAALLLRPTLKDAA
jgi:hypothetical protein